MFSKLNHNHICLLPYKKKTFPSVCNLSLILCVSQICCWHSNTSLIPITTPKGPVQSLPAMTYNKITETRNSIKLTVKTSFELPKCKTGRQTFKSLVTRSRLFDTCILLKEERGQCINLKVSGKCKCSPLYHQAFKRTLSTRQSIIFQL